MKANFKKNPRKTVKQRKTARIPSIWFWVRWLGEHTQSLLNIDLSNLFGLLEETLTKEQKLFWRRILFNSKTSFEK